MLKIIIIFYFILFYFIFVFNLPKLDFFFFYLQMSSCKNFAKVTKLVKVALGLLGSSVAQLTYKKEGGGGIHSSSFLYPPPPQASLAVRHQ